MADEQIKIPREEFDTLAPWAKMRRCVLKDDGTVAYYLHPENSAYKEDGSPADLTGTDGQVMVEIPKFYWNPDPGQTSHRWYVSSQPKETLTIHPAFFRDRNGDGKAEEVDCRYAPAFPGVIGADGKMRSLPGYTPTVSKTLGQFRESAEIRGQGWGIWDFQLWSAVQLLYLAEYANISNSYSSLGYGCLYSSYMKTGDTIQFGNASTSYYDTDGVTIMTYNDSCHAVSYRGIEHVYSGWAKSIDGLLAECISSNSSHMKILSANCNFNDEGNGYSTVAEILSTDWINGVMTNVYGNSTLQFLPKKNEGAGTSGSLNAYSSLHYCNNEEYKFHPVVSGGKFNYVSQGYKYENINNMFSVLFGDVSNFYNYCGFDNRYGTHTNNSSSTTMSGLVY